jgi:transketolase
LTTETQAPPSINPQLQQSMINAIRVLSIDQVQKANSGHPGAPLGMAPMAYTLWTRFLRFNPRDPEWRNRDKFVLSAGHASAMLYSLLYLAGYDLSLDDLKQFRQWGSRTPGHPEYEMTPGVEATTGPLGQGFANGVGMAIAEAYLAAHFNRPGYPIVDHYTYAICSDGDLQEGVAAESASLAGHLKLGKLIYLYDRNHIQLSTPTQATFTEDVLARFRAYGWHTDEVKDGNDVESVVRAIETARGVTDRPSLIAVDTIIGFASPEAGTTKVHGEALGEEAVEETKKALGWPSMEPFFVPDDVLRQWREVGARGERWQSDWTDLFDRWRQEYPELAREWELASEGRLPEGWDSEIPTYTPDQGQIATREAGGEAMNAIAARVPTLMGGDADLSSSTKTQLKKFGDFEPGHYDGRNIHFGVREHAMGSITNGISLSGMTWTYGATFFTFSDYQRPSIRLAAIMKVPNIFIYTHDSVLLGEDGPTHQPVEQLMSLRAMPDLITIRPADANEVSEAWKWVMENRERHPHFPTAIVLTRQKVPILDSSQARGGLRRGAYVLADADGGEPDVILMGTGSEVYLCVGARDELQKRGVRARVVSFPSWEIFEMQPKEYRDSVLPPGVRARVSVEAGATLGWCRWVGPDGASVGIDHFGASAPYKEAAKHMGLTVDNVVEHALRVTGKSKE